jgi:hypothetical protein
MNLSFLLLPSTDPIFFLFSYRLKDFSPLLTVKRCSRKSGFGVWLIGTKTERPFTTNRDRWRRNFHHPRQEVRIGDIERQSGLYLLGKPGMGKSALSVNLALQDIQNQHGLFFLDPHGDAIVDLLRRGYADENTRALLDKKTMLAEFGRQLQNRRFYVFDPEDDYYSFGINLLRCQNIQRLRDREDMYNRAYNVFYKIWEDEFGPWLQLILQNVLRAFIENQDYTLADVPMFLNPRNEDFRNH